MCSPADRATAAASKAQASALKLLAAASAIPEADLADLAALGMEHKLTTDSRCRTR